MKHHAIVPAILLAAMSLSSCGGGEADKGTGTKFNPSEKESSMTDSERQAAIARRKSELNIDTDSILMLNGVKFSVLPPAISAEVPKAASDKLATRIINIAAQNGVGGLCVNPVLGLVSKIDRTESSLTSTAPQKTVVKYEITLYCGNFITNDIYASASTSVTGVGANAESATLQAFGELKDTPKLKEMFRKASDNALAWYNDATNIDMVVDKAMADQNYSLAMALLSSVPTQASTHEYAAKRNAEVSDLFFQSKADELMSSMRDAIAAANGEYSPKPGAYFRLIPHTAKIYPEAEKAFEAYAETVAATRKDNLDRQRAVEDRAAADSLQIQMERLQVVKIKAPFEAQATIAQIEADAKVEVAHAKANARVVVAQANAEGKKNANTGGFLGLGKLWDDGFGLVNRLIDGDD